MTERHPSLEAFDQLIGTWVTEATHPQFDGVVAGRVTFEWLEGGHFLIMRGTTEHELFPDNLSIIGPPEDGDGLISEYFDSRGVRRTYEVAFAAGELRIWRDHEGFDQRFSARPQPDRFAGLWQLARTPGEWHDDLAMSYRRA